MGSRVIRYAQLYRVILKTFGPQLRPVGTLGLIGLQHVVNASTMRLDRVLYPGVAALPIDRPVFILGNPRSGTTFLHRTLTDSRELCGFELWEMLFPAISARKALGSVVDRFAPLSPARFHRSEAHETSLRDVETDDAMALFHFVDGPFLWSYFWAWQDHWGSDRSRRYFDPARQPPKDLEALFSYLEQCWRRNTRLKSIPRIAVKSSSLTMHVDSLLERYPDCKLLYCVRDPLEVIASGMSLVTGVLERSYSISTTTSPEDRARFLENLYQASCHLFRSFHDTWKAGRIPPENLHIVPYPTLMSDLEGAMNAVFEFLEIQPSADFREGIRKQADKQRSRVSKHAYSLSEFGLDEARIRRDLGFVYESYPI